MPTTSHSAYCGRRLVNLNWVPPGGGALSLPVAQAFEPLGSLLGANGKLLQLKMGEIALDIRRCTLQ